MGAVGLLPILIMKVLSLFDGISCGQLALNNLGFVIDKYYASEIEERSIAITQKNFPNTIQVGSVEFVNGCNLPDIDLLIGGSPCQSFSSAGDGSGFDGKSGLFWEYVRLLKETKPKYFFLENVIMKKEWQDIISKALGVQPVKINSSLVSAAHRRRLYWTNIPFENNIEDKGIHIEDVLDGEVDESLWLPERNDSLLRAKIDFNGCPDIAAIDVYNKKYKTDRKVPTLTLPHHNSLRLWQNGRIRKFSANELERMQNLPIDYTKGFTLNQRHEMIGNGWTVDIITEMFKGIVYSEEKAKQRGFKIIG